MSSTLIAAIAGGAFTLLATAAGATLTWWLMGRAARNQRAYEEDLRQRERLIGEREKLLSPRPDEAAVMRQMIHQGGELLPSRPDTSRLGFERRAGCFPRGTLVLIDTEEYRPIEELHEGDLIKVYMTETRDKSRSPVKGIVTGDGTRMVKINNTIPVTPEQQILCDGIFQRAETLRLGGVLVSNRHQAIIITSIELAVSEQDVFSVALEQSAGYFVKGPGDADSIIADSTIADSIIVREAITGKL